MSDVTSGSSNAESPAAAPKWKSLSRTERRVFGVLIEKAKTTPDGYPMTLNSITTACNQKTNRAPLMELQPEQVESALEGLRACGAVAEVQGSGRVAKYRHYAYDWLGVDKTEIAVMAELLLRGEQTVGELRGRAARMEPIADLNALRPVLESLIDKKLVVALTPEGRGQMVTHALYEPHEMKHLRDRVGAMQVAAYDADDKPRAAVATSEPARAAVATAAASHSSPAPSSRPAAAPADSAMRAAAERIEQLEMTITRLEDRIQQIESRLATVEELLN